MSSPVATLPSVCAACKARGTIQVAQEIRDGHLHWTEQFACPCGHGFGAGEVGLPPEGVRQALLAAHGAVTLWLDDAAGTDGARKVMTALLTLSAEQVEAALAEVPACLYRGTPVEVDFVEQGLARVGVRGVRREVAPPPA